MGREKTPRGKERSPTPAVSADIAHRLEYFRLRPADLDVLREVGGLFDRYLGDFVDEFYGHLQQFPATARFLSDPALVSRLKESQKAYFRSLFGGTLDQALVEHRHQIGLKHAEVGLAPQWFLGAYALYLDFCLGRLAAEKRIPHTVADLLRSLVKLILFDISLTLDAYFDRATDQLRIALQMAQKSNTELKEFARLVGHDLRTPLATVLGLCEEVIDEYGEQLPQGALELVEEARAQTRRLAHLLTELTTIGQASGDVTARENVSPGRLLEEVMDRLRDQIEAKHVTVHIEEPLPGVCTHPARFREIFYQVLSNAVKFANGPQPSVRVYAEKGEDFHTFYVEDTGPGIAKEYQDLVFVPFWRLPEHREVPGTGLGLYFVRTMVEEQGGKVAIYSEPGKGTRVAISLPAAAEQGGMKTGITK